MATQQLLILAILAMRQDALPTPDQVLRLITSQQDAIRDVSFYYEGKSSLLLEADDPEHVEGFASEFQGLYAFREDGRVFQEIFSRRGEASNRQAAVIDVDSADISHGTAKFSSGDKKDRAPFSRPYILLEPRSMHRILYRYMLTALIRRGNLGITVEGWDTIDDRKCIKVRIPMYPEFGPDPSKLFWIDLERGAHPLRVESWMKGEIRYRVDVTLKSFADVDGRPIWLPNAATVETFHWNRRYHDRPVTREFLYLVQGSVLINAGLTDAQMRDPRTRVQHAPAEYGNQEQDYRKQLKRNTGLEEGAINPVKLQENLDTMLAEAKQQNETLDASKPDASDSMWGSFALPVILGVVGISAIVGALVLRRRL